eukprot:1010951_1
MEIGEGIDAVGAVYWAQTLQKEEDYDSKVKGMDFDGKKIGFPWDHPRTPVQHKKQWHHRHQKQRKPPFKKRPTASTSTAQRRGTGKEKPSNDGKPKEDRTTKAKRRPRS